MKTCYSITIRAVEFEVNLIKDDACAYIDVQVFSRDAERSQTLQVIMKHGEQDTIWKLVQFIQHSKDEAYGSIISKIEELFPIMK